MLVVRNYSFEAAKKVVRELKVDLWGATISIMVRPRTDAVVEEFEKKFANEPDDEARQTKRFAAMMDFIIEGFSGMCDPPAEEGGPPVPWPQDLEHKKKLWRTRRRPGEKPMLQEILEFADGIAFEVHTAEAGN